MLLNCSSLSLRAGDDVAVDGFADVLWFEDLSCIIEYSPHTDPRMAACFTANFTPAPRKTDADSPVREPAVT